MKTAALAAAVLTFSLPAAAGESPYRTLLERADALVTVKFVLKVKMNGAGNNEYESEITCQLIDPEGLVLCSNTELGGYITQMSRLARGGSVSAAPSDLEVVLAGTSEGLKARLLVRDTERDLAWIRIEEPPEGPLPFLDFTESAALEIGESFYVLSRLDKFFGAVPIVREGTVGAVTARPRRLIVPAASGTVGFGVPAFTADGRLIGVTVLQVPGSEDEGGGIFSNPYSVVSSSLSMQQMIGGLILPADEIVKATQLALEIAAEDEEEEVPEGDG